MKRSHLEFSQSKRGPPYTTTQGQIEASTFSKKGKRPYHSSALLNLFVCLPADISNKLFQTEFTGTVLIGGSGNLYNEKCSVMDLALKRGTSSCLSTRSQEQGKSTILGCDMGEKPKQTLSSSDDLLKQSKCAAEVI